jgi:uncharacterized membrane protein
MTKEEFLDLLRYYFRHADKSQVEDILADYNAHFEEGIAQGMTEEEIAKELGSPKEIFESYEEEGVVKERRAPEFKVNGLKDVASDVASTAGTAAKEVQVKAHEAWQEVSPRIPGTVEAATNVLCRGFRIVCGIISFFVLIFTALIVFLLSMQFRPGMGLDPLPVFSPITLAAAAFTGIFVALAIWFIGQESVRFLKERQPASQETATAAQVTDNAPGRETAEVTEEAQTTEGTPAEETVESNKEGEDKE